MNCAYHTNLTPGDLTADYGVYKECMSCKNSLWFKIYGLCPYIDGHFK